jgi:hypothetical protein
MSRSTKVYAVDVVTRSSNARVKVLDWFQFSAGLDSRGTFGR